MELRLTNSKQEAAMEEKIQAAYDLAYKLGQDYVGSSQIDPADLEVINRYIEKGLIKYTKGKAKLSQALYYPTLESKEFEGLGMTAWLRILRLVINRLSIQSNLSINSARQYISNHWRYDIKPTVLPDSYLSKADKEAALAALEKLEATE